MIELLFELIAINLGYHVPSLLRRYLGLPMSLLALSRYRAPQRPQ
jgi:hypothetical protein